MMQFPLNAVRNDEENAFATMIEVDSFFYETESSFRSMRRPALGIPALKLFAGNRLPAALIEHLSEVHRAAGSFPWGSRMIVSGKVAGLAAALEAFSSSMEQTVFNPLKFRSALLQ